MGADYNLLLISRIRDESPHCVRVGVIRTVGSTGGVITSAGLIFAVSMFGLVFASISTMVQAGFVIGVGILLDTFLVRTVTVPAMAAIVGRANWWPSRARAKLRAPVRRAQPVPASHRLTNENRSLRDRVTLPTIITVHYRHLRTRSNEHFLDEPLPLLGTGTDGQPESLTPTNIEIAPAVHETATDNQPLPVASSQYRQLDPQNSEDYWAQYLAVAAQAMGATNGHSPAATNGHASAGTNGHVPVKTGDHDPVEANGHDPDKTLPAIPVDHNWAKANADAPAETNGHDPDKTLPAVPVSNGFAKNNGHNQDETLPAFLPNDGPSWLESHATLLKVSTVGLVTFALISTASALGPRLAAETRRVENLPASEPSGPSVGAQAAASSIPAAPAAQPAMMVLNPLQAPVAPAAPAQTLAASAPVQAPIAAAPVQTPMAAPPAASPVQTPMAPPPAASPVQPPMAPPPVEQEPAPPPPPDPLQAVLSPLFGGLP